ncbi:MAG TPA: hypothetical protein VH933_16785 [Aestuariivirgaceae bacterium]|jgi:hypothetical protein
MLDMMLKVAALAGFAATLAPLAKHVPSPDLIGVLAVVFAMAVFDFIVRPLWIGNRRR